MDHVARHPLILCQVFRERLTVVPGDASNPTREVLAEKVQAIHLIRTIKGVEGKDVDFWAAREPQCRVVPGSKASFAHADTAVRGTCIGRMCGQHVGQVRKQRCLPLVEKNAAGHSGLAVPVRQR
eukprot:282402-Rhodomonas_salina.5